MSDDAAEICTTVTLVRGRVLTMTDPEDPTTSYKFERNVPRDDIPPHMVEICREEVHVSRDSDGEEFEKEVFVIDEEAPVAAPDEKPTESRRIRITSDKSGNRRAERGPKKKRKLMKQS